VDFPHDVAGVGLSGYRPPGSVALRDAAGREVEAQLLEYDDRLVTARTQFGGGNKFLAVRMKIAFQACDVPAMGYRGYTARHVASEYRVIEHIAVQAHQLENEHLRATINADGSVDVTDKHTGQEYRGLHYFEDSGEEGGPLLHASPKHDGVFTTLGVPASISRVASGPVSATYRIEHLWSLPERLEANADIHIPNVARFIEPQRPGRSEGRAALRIVTEVTLVRGSRRLEFRTTVHNTIRDHRLRVVFPTGVNTGEHHADSPFDIVARPIPVPDSRTWYEEALHTWPSQSFVDLSDGQARGLAVLHAGITEYAVFDDPTRSIALTLLRCFGTAGAGADTYSPQPLAQLQGEQVFRYAVHPHAGDCRAARVWREAQAFTVPRRVAQCTAHRGELPFAGASFASVDSADLVVTALKQTEDGQALVLRCFNPTRSAVKAAIRLSRPVARARSIALEEKPLADLAVSGGTVPVAVAPGQILSVELTVSQDAGSARGMAAAT